MLCPGAMTPNTTVPLASRTEVEALVERAYPRTSDLEALVERIRSSAVIEPLSEFDASHTTGSAVIACATTS